MLDPRTNLQSSEPFEDAPNVVHPVCRCHDGINEEAAGIMFDFLELIKGLDMLLPMESFEREIAMLRSRILCARRLPLQTKKEIHG